ncbi:Small ribosomal subunit protein mS42 [Nakaseomyces bracarensis]|uniref:Small ribosomal subunit protein mS42 n=1 Tax=Nakaseomyces bracarensis TaxID=273131 RepID=A0ABR4NQ36_9SACH
MLLGRTVLRRGVHTVPKLPNLAQLNQHGIPKVLSNKGFDNVWNQYQQYLCDKLTLATAGSSLESYLPFHVMLKTAKNQQSSNIFNLASAAHNNHLFVENILPSIEEQSESLESNKNRQPSRLFESRLMESFESTWEQVKEEMIKRAETDVLGQGWLFLIENSYKEMHILTLQNNGTPYYFPRNQQFDMNSAINPQEYDHLIQVRKLVEEANDKGKKVEDWTMPLICVNLWDHAYLTDYGVTNRSTYVRNVLDNLNWSVVNNRLFSDPVV